MKCEIQWRYDMRRDEWDALCRQCTHTTLLQSYAYAQTMRAVHKQGVRHGIIYIDGHRAGIVQMQEVKLFGHMIHGLSIDRGPLWFNNFGSLMHTNAFTDALNMQFPNRFGRKRRFLPEFISRNAVLSFKNWPKVQYSSGYKTILVDLSPELNEIRSNLKQKWRNILNKSEKTDLTVKVDTNLDCLGTFLSQYMSDRMQRRYVGASPKFLSALAKYTGMHDECLLLMASINDEIVASILIFQHAHGATYQCGWTTPHGRDKGAHHLLLWHAIGELKNRGITDFDLGGYNDDTDGIRKFKEGLGGQNIALIGSYR